MTGRSAFQFGSRELVGCLSVRLEVVNALFVGIGDQKRLPMLGGAPFSGVSWPVIDSAGVSDGSVRRKAIQGSVSVEKSSTVAVVH